MRDSTSFRRVEFRSSEVNKKFLVRVGVTILLFLSVTLLNEAHTSKKQQNGQGVLETSLKNKKDGGRNAKNFFWLSNAFSGNFLRPGYPSRVQVKFKGTAKKPSFYRIPWFKRLWWF